MTQTDVVRISRNLKKIAENKLVGKKKDNFGRELFPSVTSVVNAALEDFLERQGVSAKGAS